MTLTQKLAFLTEQGGEDEATVLAKAVDAGLESLYREAMVEAYLSGRLSRESLAGELGEAAALDIDYQRDALQKDIEWGLAGV